MSFFFCFCFVLFGFFLFFFAPQNGPKTGFIEKVGHYVLLNLFYNENLYNLLSFCTNPTVGNIFVPEI